MAHEYPGEQLLDIHTRLMEQWNACDPAAISPMWHFALASLKFAITAMAEAEHPEVCKAARANAKHLHASDALADIGAVCFIASQVLHRRLVEITPRTTAIQRGGEISLELASLSRRIGALAEKLEPRASHGVVGNA